MLTTSYPRFPGDYRGVFVQNLERALQRAGTDVVIIEPRGFGVLKAGGGLVPSLKSSWAAKTAFPFYCLHFLLLALWRARRCDVLHANWSLAGLFAVAARTIHRRPVVLTERSSLLIASNDRRVNALMGFVVRRVSTVVAISEAARRGLLAKFPRLDISVIPNGVDDLAFSPERRARERERLAVPAGAFCIVTVGRLTEGKRVDVFLDAIERVDSGDRMVRAWIVGDGEDEAALRRRAVENAVLAEVVELTGRLSPDETASRMCAADVFVLCSGAESGGNVLLEAMASGLAVVSTPVGWANDLIRDGENGLIVPVGDAKALAGQLQLLAHSPERIVALGAAARKTIESGGLSWNGCAVRYMEQYRKVMA